MILSLLSGSSTTNSLDRAIVFSNERIENLRTNLSALVPDELSLVVFGSYARREAGPDSDLDFIIIGPNVSDEKLSGLLDFSAINAAIRESGCRAPSEGGAFASAEKYDAFCQNLGGDEDTNKKLTRRILFLLESDYIVGESQFKKLKKEIIERYIQTGIGDHQIALFLLNDIIRYYRTIAVDFEFKTGEEKKPKPWGIRNIKLVFSRKLMYASGLFSIAMTADRNKDQKIEVLEALFSLTPIERMRLICGSGEVERLLGSYNIFLGALSDDITRERLENVGYRDHESEIFRELKNESYNFTRELLKIFDRTFDKTHPIRRAVVF